MSQIRRVHLRLRWGQVEAPAILPISSEGVIVRLYGTHSKNLDVEATQNIL